MMKNRIENKLSATFGIERITVLDVSYQHKGHLPGELVETHFDIYVTSPLFKEMPPLGRHKMLHDILAEEIKELHAISFHLSAACSPE